MSLFKKLNIKIKNEIITIFYIIILFQCLLTLNVYAQTWEILTPTFSDGDSLYGRVTITFADKDNGWLILAYESDGPIREYYKKIYKTEDGGLTWVIKRSDLSQESYLQKIYSLNSSNLIALYISQKDSSLHSIVTNDNGVTWELNESDNRGIFQTPIKQIHMFNHFDGIAISNTLWFTKDGGNIWERTKDSLYSFPPPSDLCFVNDTIGWMIGPSYFAMDAGYIAKTKDGGITWKYQDSITSIIFGSDFINSNLGFIVGTNVKFSNGNIYHTNDAGNTWQFEKFDRAQVYWDVGFLDEKDGWITGVGKILKTVDGGESWGTQIEGLQTNLNKIQILKEEKVAYIFGDDFNNRTHTLLKADLSMVSNLGNEKYQTKFSLLQNYPNPFNPSTIIEYSTPKSSFITLKVYDILGSEISTLVNEVKSAGKYFVKFNGTNFPSGVYFYKLQTRNYSFIKKMILLK